MNAQVPHIATVDSVEPFLDPEAQEEIRANHVEACRELHERFVSMAKRRGVLDVEEADAIIEAIEMKPWIAYGITSLTAYLEHVFGYGPRQAVERERVARELTKLPDMYQSLKHGLPWTKVRELTRVATPETETAWLDAAQDMNMRQVEALVRGHEKGDLPTSPTKPELAKQPRVIEMTDETYALFRQWKAMVSDECGELIDDEHALAAALQRCVAGDGAERPASQVAYTVCPNCKATTVDGAGMVADVPAATRERVLCDCDDLGDLAAPSPARHGKRHPAPAPPGLRARSWSLHGAGLPLHLQSPDSSSRAPGMRWTPSCIEPYKPVFHPPQTPSRWQARHHIRVRPCHLPSDPRPQ